MSADSFVTYIADPLLPKHRGKPIETSAVPQFRLTSSERSAIGKYLAILNYAPGDGAAGPTFEDECHEIVDRVLSGFPGVEPDPEPKNIY